MSKWVFRLVFFGTLSIFGKSIGAQLFAQLNVVVINDPDQQQDYARRIIYAEVLREVSSSSNFYRIVEREHYDVIMKEREAAAKFKDDPYIASILSGATLAIDISIKDYVENWDSIPIPEVLYGRSHEYKLMMECFFEFKVYDIATSEVLGFSVLHVDAIPGPTGKRSNELQKHFLRQAARGQIRKGVRELVRRQMMQITQPSLEILELTTIDGKQYMHVLGGNKAKLPLGAIFRIIRESLLSVNGRDVLRQETIGEVKVVSQNDDYARCDIIGSVTSLPQLINNKTVGYLLLSDKNEFPTHWSERYTPPKQ